MSSNLVDFTWPLYLLYLFQRKAKFSETELRLLVDHIEMYKYELYGYVNSSQGPATSHRTIQNVWDKIAELMAGTGTVIRTPANLRRKKETWFSLVKQKVR